MAIYGTVLSRLWHICGINVAYAKLVQVPFRHMQVDPKCLEPGYGLNDRIPLLHLQVGEDCDGQPLTLDLVPPAVAIAALVFHPCNWDAMHKRAAPVFGTAAEVDEWLQGMGYA